MKGVDEKVFTYRFGHTILHDEKCFGCAVKFRIGDTVWRIWNRETQKFERRCRQCETVRRKKVNNGK